MSEPWKTGAVLALVNDMRQSQDFGNLPILADALEDGGYADDGVLAKLRAGLDYVAACRLLCELLGGEYAESVKWMEDFARRMRSDDGDPRYDIDYDGVMEAARDYLSGGWGRSGRGYHWQDTFEENRREFWRHYEVLTGRAVDPDIEDDYGSVFSCSC